MNRYGSRLPLALNAIAVLLLVLLTAPANARASETDILSDPAAEQAEAMGEEEPQSLSAPELECANRWVRLGGKNALGTMQEIVKEGFTAADTDTVVVATSKSYKDALAASPLAGEHGAPILLTNPNALSAQTKTEIKRLQAKNVYIVGGTLAVSTEVERQIKALPSVSRVERIAGKNAPDTSRKIASRIRYSDWVVIATSTDFADALSIAPWAYASHSPLILLGSNKSLSTSSLAVIKDLKVSKAIIVGGQAAVPKAVESALKGAGLSVTRLGGKNAVDTSRLVANFGLAQGMRLNYAGIATRNSFKDALTGAAFLGRLRAPLILTTEKNRSAIKAVLENKCQELSVGYVFGGEMAVSKATWDYTLETFCDSSAHALNNAYTVRFKANGGTGTMQDQQIEAGTAANLSPTTFTKTGYDFKAWNTKADGTGTSYEYYGRVLDIAAPGKTVTLYAQWEPITYTIRFESNVNRYAYYNSLSGDTYYQEVAYDASIPLYENRYKFSSYSFAGWNTKADGSGTAYKDGQSVKNLTTSGSVTLYAQWYGGDEPEIGIRSSSRSSYDVAKQVALSSRQADGSNIYTICVDTDRSLEDIQKNLTIRYTDVTPPAYKRMFKDMGISMSAPKTKGQVFTDYSTNPTLDGRYPSSIWLPFDANDTWGKVARSTLQVTVSAGMGVRALKVEAIYKGEVVDSCYVLTNGWTPEGEYSQADTQLYADVRRKVEAKLWKPGMSNSQKLAAIASYINNTTHYPDTNATDAIANPEYWADWSVDGMELYYYMANDTRLNRVMRFQGGPATCQASDTIVIVATDDLGLPYLYDGDTDTIAEGEGVWHASGKYSSNPGNPYHETAVYQYPDGTQVYIDVQGVMTSCSSHDCKTELISLK